MELYCEENIVYVENHNTEQERRFHGEGDEPYLTRYSTIVQLYRACVKEHGRCVSKEYVDIEGKSVQVGWVFFKRATSKDQYDVETWVTVYTQPPTKRVVWEGAKYPTFKKEKNNGQATHPQ